MTTQFNARARSAPELPLAARLPGVIFRPFRDAADYELLSGLTTQTNTEDRIPWIPTAAQLRTEMETSSGVDPTRDVLLALLDDVLIGATGVERVVREGIPVYDMWGNVLTEFRRRGLGAALLEWTLDRIRDRAAIEDPRADVFVQGGAEDQETGHRALLERAAFAPVRHFFLMRRGSLLDVPDAPLADGLEIRTVTRDQRRPIIAAEFEAFRDHWGSRDLTEDAVRRTLEMAELDTDLWIVAWDGDQIAGVVENWIWAGENKLLGIRRGWLERISVRRPWRRRGVARALTAASLVRLREAGMREAMLGVDSENPNGALGLYKGLGFEVHSRSAAYRRPLEP